MTGPVRINLPWPSRKLHPNSRPHYMAKASATKAARETARWAVKAAKIGKLDAKAIVATAIFTPPTYHARDIDGMQASIKAYSDGIADEIGVDDKHWKWRAPEVLPFKAPGSVTIQIEVLP